MERTGEESRDLAGGGSALVLGSKGKSKNQICRDAGIRTALLVPAGYLRVRFSLWGCRDVL